MAENNDDKLAVTYNFADLNLWKARFDSIDDMIDGAFRLCERVLVTIGGVSVQEFISVLPQEGQDLFKELLKKYANQSGDEADRLFCDEAISILDKAESHQAIGFALWNLFYSLLNNKALPLSTDRQVLPPHIKFELMQIISFYVFIIRLNSFAWGSLKSYMLALLNESGDAHLPLIRHCLQYAGLDANLLYSALAQRTWQANRFDQRGYSRSELSKALLVTDKLILWSLAPFQQWLPSGRQIIPITHFSETTHIHRFPYSDQFLLVGLRYDRASLAVNVRLYDGEESKTFDEKKMESPAFDIMAIPHEAGHFVYRHATLKNQQTFIDIDARFESNICYKWREEIFADVYGCLVGGPLCALGLQAILATGYRDHLWMDDDEHPIPLLRPYILSEILRVLQEQKGDRYPFKSVAQSLDQNWSAILQQRGFVLRWINRNSGRPARITLTTPANIYVEEVLNVSDAIDDARLIIAEYVRVLLSHADLGERGTAELGTFGSIPWAQRDESSLQAYNKTLVALTDDDVADILVPNYGISDGGQPVWVWDDKASPEEILRAFLDEWDDKGDGGHGRGT